MNNTTELIGFLEHLKTFNREKIEIDLVLKNLQEIELNKIEEAKNTLKKAGYYTDKLWSVSDVKTKFQCTDFDAQKILDKSLNNEATMEQIWFSIQEFGELMNLKTKK